VIVKIKIEQSGGFAGISSSNEIDAAKLPASLEGTVRELLAAKKISLMSGLGRPTGAADHLNYKITIENGNKKHVIKCNELEMDTTVKSLINYIKKNSKRNYLPDAFSARR